MSYSLKDLKKNTHLEKLTKALESTQTKKYANDDRFWKPEVDKAGNGQALIRFLSAPFVDGPEGTEWVQMFTHGFKGPGGWYIENCPTTPRIEKPCPVCINNTKLWETGDASLQKVASNRKRKLVYISNILVVADYKRPENNGKIFLFKYGKKIFEKIDSKLNPKFEGEVSVNPFDFWKGANFKLRVQSLSTAGGPAFPNYDKSEFDAPSAIAERDEEIDEIWRNSYSLQNLVAMDKFKSFDLLKNSLVRVLPELANDYVESPEPTQEAKTPKSIAMTTQVTAEDASPFEADEDPEVAFFDRLARESGGYDNT